MSVHHCGGGAAQGSGILQDGFPIRGQPGGLRVLELLLVGVGAHVGWVQVCRLSSQGVARQVVPQTAVELVGLWVGHYHPWKKVRHVCTGGLRFGCGGLCFIHLMDPIIAPSGFEK